MLKPFYNEVTVKVGGDTLRLVINFRAIDATEQLMGVGYDTIIAQLTNLRTRMPVASQAKVVWGMLREHHPDIDIEQVLSLVYDPEHSPTVGMAIAKLIRDAFPTAEPEKAKGQNPRKRRGASSPSS